MQLELNLSPDEAFDSLTAIVRQDVEIERLETLIGNLKAELKNAKEELAYATAERAQMSRELRQPVEQETAA